MQKSLFLVLSLIFCGCASELGDRVDATERLRNPLARPLVAEHTYRAHYLFLPSLGKSFDGVASFSELFAVRAVSVDSTVSTTLLSEVCSLLHNATSELSSRPVTLQNNGKTANICLTAKNSSAFVREFDLQILLVFDEFDGLTEYVVRLYDGENHIICAPNPDFLPPEEWISPKCGSLPRVESELGFLKILKELKEVR